MEVEAATVETNFVPDVEGRRKKKKNKERKGAGPRERERERERREENLPEREGGKRETEESYLKEENRRRE